MDDKPNGIEDQKKVGDLLRKQEAEWRNTFDSISDFISIHDKDFHILRVNKALADFLKMTPEEIIGKHCYELLHGTTEPWSTCPHVATLKSGKSETREVDDPRIGRTLLVSTSPIFDEDGQLTGSVHVAKDITERKKAEDDRERLLMETERVNKELNDFAYIVSHDLKAPLRGITQLTEWLSEDYMAVLDEEGRDKLKLLKKRALRMHSMIDGILRYSRAGRVKGEPLNIDTGAAVRHIIDSLLPPKSIRITINDSLPTVVIDPLQINQVFQNLISNAVKYMDKPEGFIEIGCMENSRFYEFFVRDNGPGIEEKHFERIFQIFQALTPKDEFESTGIGLTIVKKIIEQNGGKIWVESELGKGSTFKFTIPKII